jgi:hypothetical protein
MRSATTAVPAHNGAVQRIFSPLGRRRWSRAEKERIVAAALGAGRGLVRGGACSRYSHQPNVPLATAPHGLPSMILGQHGHRDYGTAVGEIWSWRWEKLSEFLKEFAVSGEVAGCILLFLSPEIRRALDRAGCQPRLTRTTRLRRSIAPELRPRDSRRPSEWRPARSCGHRVTIAPARRGRALEFWSVPPRCTLAQVR